MICITKYATITEHSMMGWKPTALGNDWLWQLFSVVKQSVRWSPSDVLGQLRIRIHCILVYMNNEVTFWAKLCLTGCRPTRILFILDRPTRIHYILVSFFCLLVSCILRPSHSEWLTRAGWFLIHVRVYRTTGVRHNRATSRLRLFNLSGFLGQGTPGQADPTADIRRHRALDVTLCTQTIPDDGPVRQATQRQKAYRATILAEILSISSNLHTGAEETHKAQTAVGETTEDRVGPCWTSLMFSWHLEVVQGSSPQ